MPWWGWIVTGAGFLALEVVLNTDFFLVFFGASALILGVAVGIGPSFPVPLQWLAFAALSAVTLVLFRGRVRERFRRPDHGAVGELAGRRIHSSADLRVGERGSIELQGSVWNALNAGQDPIRAGDTCVVERLEGLTLHLMRVSSDRSAEPS